MTNPKREVSTIIVILSFNWTVVMSLKKSMKTVQMIQVVILPLLMDSGFV